MTDQTSQPPVNPAPDPNDDSLSKLDELLAKAKAKRSQNDSTEKTVASKTTPATAPNSPAESQSSDQHLPTEAEQVAAHEAAQAEAARQAAASAAQAEELRKEQLAAQQAKMAELQQTSQFKARQTQNQQKVDDEAQTESEHQGHDIVQMEEKKI